MDCADDGCAHLLRSLAGYESGSGAIGPSMKAPMAATSSVNLPLTRLSTIDEPLRLACALPLSEWDLLRFEITDVQNADVLPGRGLAWE